MSADIWDVRSVRWSSEPLKPHQKTVQYHDYRVHGIYMSDSIKLTDFRSLCNHLVKSTSLVKKSESDRFRYLEMIPSSRPQLVCLPCFSQSVEFPALQFQQSIFGKFE